LTSCIGWLLDVSIDNDRALLFIKTGDGQTIKLRDSYYPGFYTLPRNESLFQILLREEEEEEIAVRWEDRHTSLLDNKKTRNLIYVELWLAIENSD
jgi:hypothetical protein